MIWAATARGMSRDGLGSSSDIWVTASGVPIVNAPLRTPVRKVTPSGQPAALFAWKSPHTALLLACCFGMAATTMMVTKPPTIIRNNPAWFKRGSRRFPNTTTAQHIQVTRMKAT